MVLWVRTRTRRGGHGVWVLGGWLQGLLGCSCHCVEGGDAEKKCRRTSWRILIVDD